MTKTLTVYTITTRRDVCNCSHDVCLFSLQLVSATWGRKGFLARLCIVFNLKLKKKIFVYFKMLKSSVVPSSTYQVGFRVTDNEKFLPPIKFSQIPSFLHIDRCTRGLLPPRQFPIEPVGPRRELELEPESGPVVGLCTKGVSTER